MRWCSISKRIHGNFYSSSPSLKKLRKRDRRI
jgi:hypothetical protein